MESTLYLFENSNQEILGFLLLGTIHCTFDNGRRLGIVPEVDSFRKLTQDELFDEQSAKLQMKFIDKVNNEVIPCIEWVGMKNAYKNGDMAVPNDLLKMLHEKFVEVYGSDHIEESMGMLTVPGVVRANDGNTYVALLIIDTESAGEHWGTTLRNDSMPQCFVFLSIEGEKPYCFLKMFVKYP